MSQKADKKSSKFVYILASFKLKNFLVTKEKSFLSKTCWGTLYFG